MSKPLFKEVSYSLSKLMDDVEMGEIGLPDIQSRRFICKVDTKPDDGVHKTKV
jgi:hypothetical protein